MIRVFRQFLSAILSLLFVVPAYSHANDQLSTDTYDGEGNTVGSNGNGYVYDFEDRLIQQGGNTYSYDGDGNRVQKLVAGVYTNYLVDPLNPTGYAQVLTENYYNGTGPGEVQHRYIYGLERLSEVRDSIPGNRQYIFYVYDGHGSVRALTDQSGTVTDTYDYDAFGTLIHSTGTTYNNYLFAGEQFDPDLGLYYNRARYLSTNTGRFWTMDSDEGDDSGPQSLHKYLFASADPTNRSDPSGNDDLAELGAGFGLSEALDSMSALQVTTFLTIPAKVEVHFDKLGHFPIYGDYYHAFLLVFKPGSLQPLVFRAGPSQDNPDASGAAAKDLRGVDPNADLGFGNITTGGCVDVPWTAASHCDFPHPGNPNDDVTKMTLPTGVGTVDTLLTQLAAAAHKIDSLQLPYHPVTQNSNSFVHTLIKKASLRDVPPPVHVPGWDHILY